MKKAIVLVAAALVIPTSVAFAKANPTRGKSNPQVMYVVKGILSSYTPGASITIDVKHSNYHARALRNAGLIPLPLTAKTRVTYVNGATTITDGARGIIKFKAPLRATAGSDLATTLEGAAKVRHIIDQSRH